MRNSSKSVEVPGAEAESSEKASSMCWVFHSRARNQIESCAQRSLDFLQRSGNLDLKSSEQMVSQRDMSYRRPSTTSLRPSCGRYKSQLVIGMPSHEQIQDCKLPSHIALLHFRDEDRGSSRKPRAQYRLDLVPLLLHQHLAYYIPDLGRHMSCSRQRCRSEMFLWGTRTRLRYGQLSLSIPWA